MVFIWRPGPVPFQIVPFVHSRPWPQEGMTIMMCWGSSGLPSYYHPRGSELSWIHLQKQTMDFGFPGLSFSLVSWSPMDFFFQVNSQQTPSSNHDFSGRNLRNMGGYGPLTIDLPAITLHLWGIFGLQVPMKSAFYRVRPKIVVNIHVEKIS